MIQYLFSHHAAGTSHSGSSPARLSAFPASRISQRTAVDRQSFIDSMKGAVTGVNIVTTDGDAGRFGLTVSAFASVSAEPPLVLVCINRRSPACAAILENRGFCVNVLARAQQGLAEQFAGMAGRGTPYEFNADTWAKTDSGNPVLERAVAAFDCSVVTAIDAGTHTIFTGLVEFVTANSDEPLLYSNRTFGRIAVNDDRTGMTRS